MAIGQRRRRRWSFCRRCLGVTISGWLNSALTWGGTLGAALVGVTANVMEYDVTFAASVLGGAASGLIFAASAGIVIFIGNLLYAPFIVRRRDRPLKIMFGSEDPFYTDAENENLITQTVSIGIKNISDIHLRNCRLQITDINPTIANLPIYLAGVILLHSGDVECIGIAYFHKGKNAAIRQLGICTPLLPVYGGNILTIPEDCYDIRIEASCNEAHENQVIYCRLSIDERDTLRLAVQDGCRAKK